MALYTDRYTRLTNELERELVRLGGGDPDRVISREALSDMLVKAIEAADAHDPELLDRLWARIAEKLTPEERSRLEKLASMLAQD